MHHHVAPSIRSWYEDEDKHSTFKVVSEDLEEGLIEIQYFSGEIEELEIDTWFSLNLRSIPEPEDCSGPFELSQEDLGYDTQIKPAKNWSEHSWDLGSDNKINSYFDDFDQDDY